MPSLTLAQVHKIHQEFSAMGTRFGITLSLTDSQLDSSEVLVQLAKNEVNRIEALISSWDENSQTAKINRNAGIKPIKVDQELYELIQRGLHISKITSGAFDLTFAGIESVWKFDGSITDLPDSTAVFNSRKLIDHKAVTLDQINHSVYLHKHGMRIGFGGIGKGYAANMVRKILKEHGVSGGTIDAGGDLITWGKNHLNKPWKVGVRNPGKDETAIGYLNVSGKAVVTSGNYERFIVFDGLRYSHIIDPRTGWPAKGLKSATIVADDAELADALATAVFVLGKEVGLDLIEQLPNIDCVVIDDSDHIFTTKGIALLRE